MMTTSQQILAGITDILASRSFHEAAPSLTPSRNLAPLAQKTSEGVGAAFRDVEDDLREAGDRIGEAFSEFKDRFNKVDWAKDVFLPFIEGLNKLDQDDEGDEGDPIQDFFDFFQDLGEDAVLDKLDEIDDDSKDDDDGRDTDKQTSNNETANDDHPDNADDNEDHDDDHGNEGGNEGGGED